MHWYDKMVPPHYDVLDLCLAENVRRCQVHQPAEMTEIFKKIAVWMKAQEYPAKDVCAVILTVHEATSNAFRHGNRGDCSKPVRISYLVNTAFCSRQGAGTGADLPPEPSKISIPPPNIRRLPFFACSPAAQRKKIIVRRFRRGGQYLIAMPDPLKCEFSFWPVIIATV